MLIPVCDRCKRQGQIITVLGKDICTAHCVPLLREWLAVPQRHRRMLASERMEHIRRMCERDGYVEARHLSELTGERSETAQEALRRMEARGELCRVSRGRYSLPLAEAAE